MSFETGNGERHHQLLGVPKGENGLLPLGKYPRHMLHAFGPPAHRALQQLNDGIPNRRHQCDFECIREALRQGLFRWGPRREAIGHGVAHWFTLCPQLLRKRIRKLHGMQALIEAALAQQLVMRADFRDRAAIEHNNTIGILNSRQPVRDHKGGPVPHQVG